MYADIIIINKVIIGDEYALYIVCLISKFYKLTTTNIKAVVLDMIAIIKAFKHTFKTKVLVIHMDGESSLNGQVFRK